MKLSLKHMAKSTTLGDMSMNRSLLGWLVLKGALVGIIAGFFGATFRYMILESEDDVPNGSILDTRYGREALYHRSIAGVGAIIWRFRHSSNRRGNDGPL